MEISDKQTLLVLMTSLCYTKWESDDDDSRVAELSGSPYFAKLYNDVVDEVIRLDSGRSAAIQRWQEWRAIEGRPLQLELVKARIKKLPLWVSWSREQREQVVATLLSPFTATDATLEALISL